MAVPPHPPPWPRARVRETAERESRAEAVAAVRWAVPRKPTMTGYTTRHLENKSTSRRRLEKLWVKIPVRCKGLQARVGIITSGRQSGGG